MPQPHADRNLLFGILALQMDFISRDALVAAMHAWVFAKLATELPRFRYDPQRRFRGWLHTILLNRWRDEERRRRQSRQTSAPEVLDQLETTDNVDDWTEEQYRAYLVGWALELMRAEFAPRDWQSFWEVAVNGRKADEVAQQFGLTRNQVYLARSRIRHRLKCELDGLLEDD